MGRQLVTVLSIFAALLIISTAQKYIKYNLHGNSVSELSRFWHLEGELMKNLENFVDELQEKRNILLLARDQMHGEHMKSLDNPEEYLANMYNSFSLIRRMHSDWPKWQKYLQEETGKSKIDTMEELLPQLPTDADLEEAAMDIFRLQKILKLDPIDLANSSLNAQQYDTGFSAIDCFTVAKFLYSRRELNTTIQWFRATDELLDPSKTAFYNTLSFGRANISFWFSETYVTMERHNDSIYHMSEAVSQRPRDEYLLRAQTNLEDFIANKELCRSRAMRMSRLHCRYNSSTTPFAILAPFKTEEIAKDPYIVIYHDVIYDSEIDELKNTSTPILKRGRLGHIVKGYSTQRLAKAANFNSNASATAERISQRIVDMTGLDFSAFPNLHVANYGIGGHYYNHHDYINKTLFPEMVEDAGNRLATVLFYLSDVEKGGATVFPKVNIISPPRKGSAILFYHLDNSGNGNQNSLHASCPVLVGSKWAPEYIYGPVLRLAYVEDGRCFDDGVISIMTVRNFNQNFNSTLQD